jgi:hypothetical protein
MAAGFVFNLLIANLVLDNLGGEFFATYAAITSIPLILSFLDLSMSQIVYNSLTSIRDFTTEKKARSDITRVLFVLTLISFAFCILTLIIVIPLSLTKHFYSLGNGNFTLVLAINLILNFLSLPLNIGFKILSALGKINVIIWIQSFAPPLTLLGSFLLINVDGNFNFAILTLPAFVTFVISLIGFSKARTWRYFERTNLNGILAWFKFEAIPLAFWSTCLTALTILLLQFPRYYLLKYGDTESAVSFNFFFMFLLPGQSLVITYCAVSGPKFRGKDSHDEQRNHMRRALVMAISLSIIFGTLILLTSLVKFHYFIRFIDFSEAKYIVISLILYSLWFVPLSSLTEAKSAQQFTYDFLIVGVLIVFMLAIFRQSSFQEFMTQIYIPAHMLIATRVLFSQSKLIKSKYSKEQIHDS